MTGPSGELRVDLPVAGRMVAVVGGGVVALGRIAALRAAGADVVVFSADPVASVADYADRELITLHKRAVSDGPRRGRGAVLPDRDRTAGR